MSKLEEWRPIRKVIGAAIAAVLIWIVQIVWPEIDVPPGIEGAITVLVAYLLPDPKVNLEQT